MNEEPRCFKASKLSSVNTDDLNALPEWYSQLQSWATVNLIDINDKGDDSIEARLKESREKFKAYESKIEARKQLEAIPAPMRDAAQKAALATMETTKELDKSYERWESKVESGKKELQLKSAGYEELRKKIEETVDKDHYKRLTKSILDPNNAGNVARQMYMGIQKIIQSMRVGDSEGVMSKLNDQVVLMKRHKVTTGHELLEVMETLAALQTKSQELAILHAIESQVLDKDLIRAIKEMWDGPSKAIGQVASMELATTKHTENFEKVHMSLREAINTHMVDKGIVEDKKAKRKIGDGDGDGEDKISLKAFKAEIAELKQTVVANAAAMIPSGGGRGRGSWGDFGGRGNFNGRGRGDGYGRGGYGDQRGGRSGYGGGYGGRGEGGRGGGRGRGNNVCYQWREGNCTRGDSCRFSHTEGQPQQVFERPGTPITEDGGRGGGRGRGRGGGPGRGNGASG